MGADGDRPSEAESPQRKAAFRPYIAATTALRELTPLPLILGTLLGIVFGASSLYLVLKVGLTVSASIPVAVISITFFRVLSKFGVKNATILENNIVQTAGSAGESLAFGVGVTMPAIMILGFDLEITRVMLVGVLGGLLGILMMIPLRRALIVEQHGSLKYPEGTACAEVLKAGASDESRAAAADELGVHAGAPALIKGGEGTTIFAGFGVGLLYKAAMAAASAWKAIPEKVFGAPLAGGSISAEISPELLGVGYIIGPRIAATMCAGGVLAYLVLIPLIKFFGGDATAILAPGTMPIAKMTPDDVRGAYVLYIGAGAVAAGGIISLTRSLPMIVSGLRHGLRDVSFGKKKSSPASIKAAVPRTERDLSMKVVLIGAIVLMAAIVLAPTLRMNAAGALMIVVFGFLFVTVSSRLTGEIGSSSNPISGMTIATLLLTCAIFLVLGWTGSTYYVTALSVGAIVCIAASNGGTTSQDLKTGYLIGATPRLQQIAILVGSLASALVLGPILLSLNETSTVYAPRVTLEPVKGVSLPPEKAQMTPLPPYRDEAKLAPAGGPYGLLTIADGEPWPGLAPGDYLVNPARDVPWRVQNNFPEGMHVDIASLESKEKQKLSGPQGVSDPASYYVWWNREDPSGHATKYLVNDAGDPVYLVDPGISGVHATRPDGSKVPKFQAPTATLMSYIIKGILSHQLPWGLVLLGVMIAIVLEMAGIPSLAFAVGVYLPLSSSTPIFAGGLVRWLVDLHVRKKFKHAKMTEEELIAESDKSPGVLMASGYIAGGAIAGIVIAFMTGLLSDTYNRVESWATEHNPFFEGPHADLLSMIPFVVISLLLFLVGREVLLARKPS